MNRDEIKELKKLINGKCGLEIQEEDIQLMEEDADEGDPDAMCMLAYLNMSLRSADYDKDWCYDIFKEAAEKGQPTAMYEVGIESSSILHMVKHNNVEINDRKALEYLGMAAKAGIADAMVGIGMHYYYGCGCESDNEKAVLWFRKGKDFGSFYRPDICVDWLHRIKNKRTLGADEIDICEDWRYGIKNKRTLEADEIDEFIDGFFHWAALNGSPKAMYWIGRDEGDSGWMQRACITAGSSHVRGDALVRLGILYEDFFGGDEIRILEASETCAFPPPGTITREELDDMGLSDEPDLLVPAILAFMPALYYWEAGKYRGLGAKGELKRQLEKRNCDEEGLLSILEGIKKIIELKKRRREEGS